MKTVIITGGAGFIGSYLCEAFLNKDYKILCVDNLVTGNKKNIKTLESNSNFFFIEADVSKISVKEKIINFVNEKQLEISHILHFASPAGPNPNSPKSYLQMPVETYLVNSLGTHLMLELTKKFNAKFLFASTSEVYGDPLEHPQKESYLGNVNTLGPRSCYDVSKRFGEMATITYGKKHKLDALLIRIFNTYGPRMNVDDGRVIPLFITKALENKTLTIYGEGNQTRSFCYISDQIDGIINLIEKAEPYSVYNIGNDSEITINTLANTIKDLTDSSSEIEFKPLPKDDPTRRKPDISKAKKDLNWEPQIKLEDGLKKTIKFFEKHN